MARTSGNEYRDGAQERLREAAILLKNEHFGGCIYLGGRAVEGMLRAVIWHNDADYVTGRKMLETGHSLRRLIDAAANLGVLRNNPRRDSIAAAVQAVGRLWWNDMRYLPESVIKTKWFELREIGGKRTLKRAVIEYYDVCSMIIHRCEALWRS